MGIRTKDAACNIRGDIVILSLFVIDIRGAIDKFAELLYYLSLPEKENEKTKCITRYVYSRLTQSLNFMEIYRKIKFT